MDQAYRQKMRSLSLNLKDKNNPALRAAVVDGSIAAEKLVFMSAQVSQALHFCRPPVPEAYVSHHLLSCRKWLQTHEKPRRKLCKWRTCSRPRVLPLNRPRQTRSYVAGASSASACTIRCRYVPPFRCQLFGFSMDCTGSRSAREAVQTIEGVGRRSCQMAVTLSRGSSVRVWPCRTGRVES